MLALVLGGLLFWQVPASGQLTELGANDFTVYAQGRGYDSARPVMARDEVNGQVLVVWLQDVTLDKQGFEVEVYGKLYNDDGTVAKQAFAISEVGIPGKAGGPSHVAISFNPKSGNFLVVWAALDTDFSPKDSLIIGREIDEGDLASPETVLRQESTVDLTFPAVACDTLTGNFVLAWRRGDKVQHMVLDQDLGLEESAEDTLDLPATRVGDAFRAPSVVFQSIGGDFLVSAIVDDAGSGTELRGRVVEPFAIGTNPVTLLAPGATHFAVTAGARNSSARYGVVYRDPRLRAVLLNGGLTPVAGPFEVTPGEISQLERPTAVTFDPDSQVYYATWIDEISSANFSLNITAWERDGAVSLPSQPLGQMFASAASATINAYAAALMVPGGVTPELWLTWPPAV